MEHYAFEYGETYDAYLATEDDRQYFWSPGRRGVIGFVRWRRVLNVLGGLLAPAQHREELLHKFIEFVRRNQLTVNFFNVGRMEERLFRRHGFKINKCAEELIVRLDRTNWQGKDFNWLRRQENLCVRQHLRVEEIVPESDPEEYRNRIVPELEEVNREHLAGTLHGRELVVFEGRFDPWSLRRRRLFVTRRGNRIVAFVVCNPALGGDVWAIEIYRRRRDSPRGVIPFTMLQIMRQLKDEGVPYASLSSVPFLRCGPPSACDDWRYSGVSQIFWKRMNWLFDVRGIYHFKSRFRPEYREMFLATYPAMTIASMYAMGASWQLFRVSPLRLLRHLVRFCSGLKRRKELAVPAPWPERKIRRLRRQLPSPEQETVPAVGSGNAEGAARGLRCSAMACRYGFRGAKRRQSEPPDPSFGTLTTWGWSEPGSSIAATRPASSLTARLVSTLPGPRLGGRPATKPTTERDMYSRA